ncbi:MAG: GntR family transcriptional regulator [Clostridia bacterium]|nr:GntR family transcriptional regulator [Clostridia bacterium]
MISDIFDGRLDVTSEVPLYHQLVLMVKRNITSGMLKPGDVLPSELELCDRYGISRSTVRQAFAALEAEGMVERHRGKGTFVSEPKLNRKLANLYSFTDEMKGLGLEPKSEILGFELITPAEDLVARLKLGYGERVFKIVRLRSANGEPLMIETGFIPEKICPVLTREILDNHSLYTTISKYSGMKAVRAVESYEATTIDKNEADLLKSRPGSGAFFVQRLSENDAGDIFELALLLVRGDRCRYEIALEPDNVSVQRRFAGAEKQL